MTKFSIEECSILISPFLFKKHAQMGCKPGTSPIADENSINIANGDCWRKVLQMHELNTILVLATI